MTTVSGAARAGPGQVPEVQSNPGARAGNALWAGIGCFGLWSGMPLLFMGLARFGVEPWEIVADRCLLSLPLAGGLLLLAGGAPEMRRLLRTPRTLLWLAASSALISVNWGIYIWAATHGRNLDSSLAYYINPLLNMAAGALLFHERLSRAAAVAIGLAAVGVALQGLAVGHPPWVALSLAITFWAYGVIRKRVAASAPAGLFVECLILAPLGLAYLLAHSLGHFGRGAAVSALILATGPATVIPLALFSHAARKLPLSTMGFLQFITPTALFGVAMATGEPLTPMRALSFAFIWGGVCIFAAAAWRAARPQAAQR